MSYPEQAGAGAGRPRGTGPSKLKFALAGMVLAGVAAAFAGLAFLAASFIDRVPEGAKAPPSGSVRVISTEQIVFDHSREACTPWTVPDAPARAFRDLRDDVQLVLSHFDNRRMVGPSLGRLEPRCRAILRSAKSANPSSYQDRQWIASLYTDDGKKVHALLHNEYQGHRHAGRCPSDDYQSCWYNAITFAVSNDGGASFAHPPGAAHLVAAVPYRYAPDAGPTGLFEPSNIVRNTDDRNFYALVRAERYKAQKPGVCLMRTPSLDDPTAWRGWDGEDFTVRFDDPYRGAATAAARHVCKPVAFDEIQTMTSSLTYNTFYDQWLLVGVSGRYDLQRRAVVFGIYYSLSDDLVEWSDRRLIRETELLWTFECGDSDPIHYPSLIDPSSQDRTFGTTGRRPYLYYTQFNYENCEPGPDRDLVRVRLEFED